MLRWFYLRLEKMQSRKFNLFLILISLLPISISAMTFDENLCFKKKYEVNLQRKVGPFGLGERKLRIGKIDCALQIEYQAFQYNKSFWKVDICREPVHVKEGQKSVEVIQKNEECISAQESPFCERKEVILKLIEDEGLIFATGAREDFNSDHGKVFCSYLLLKYYLNGNSALNRNIFFQGELLNVNGRSSRLGSKGKKKDSLPNLSVKSDQLFDF